MLAFLIIYSLCKNKTKFVVNVVSEKKNSFYSELIAKISVDTS